MSCDHKTIFVFQISIGYWSVFAYSHPMSFLTQNIEDNYLNIYDMLLIITLQLFTVKYNFIRDNDMHTLVSQIFILDLYRNMF